MALKQIDGEHFSAIAASSNKWISQLVGLPTISGGLILVLRATGGGSGFLIELLLLLPIIMIYDLLYQYIFPNYDARGKYMHLVIFFFAQVVVWAVVLLIANHALI